MWISADFPPSGVQPNGSFRDLPQKHIPDNQQSTVGHCQIGTTFASTCHIGLAVSSGSDTTLNTSQFSSVSVTP